MGTLAGMRWTGPSELCIEFDSAIDPATVPTARSFYVYNSGDSNAVCVQGAKARGNRLYLAVETDMAERIRQKTGVVRYDASVADSFMKFADGTSVAGFTKWISDWTEAGEEASHSLVFLSRKEFLAHGSMELGAMLAEPSFQWIGSKFEDSLSVETTLGTFSSSMDGVQILDGGRKAVLSGTHGDILAALKRLRLDAGGEAMAKAGQSGTLSAGMLSFSGGEGSALFSVVLEEPVCSVFDLGGTEKAHVNGIEGLTAASFSASGSYSDAALFDAEKTKEGTLDSLQCWAGAASDMLAAAGYAEAEGDREPEDAAFDRFRAGFENSGAKISNGVVWYLNGFYRDESFSTTAQPKDGAQGGFCGVRPNALAANDVSSMRLSIAAAVDDLADAIFAGDAAALSLQKSSSSAHAVACWGISYDASKSRDDPEWLTGFYITHSDDSRAWTPQRDILRHIGAAWDADAGVYRILNWNGASGSSIYSWHGMFTALAGKNSMKELMLKGGAEAAGSGMLLSGARAEEGQAVVVLAGGSAAGASIAKGARMLTEGTDSGSEVAGEHEVRPGGLSVGAFVSAGGRQRALAGGRTSGASVEGVLDVLASGFASGAMIGSGGSCIVRGRGSALAASAGSGAVLYEKSKAVMSKALVAAGGSERVSSGARSVSASVAGVQYVWGTASAAVLLSGGRQHVRGLAKAGTVSSGGLAAVKSGGRTSAMSILAGGSARIYSGALSVGARIAGVERIHAGGSASGAFVLAGGAQIVSGTASGARVSSGGKQHVRNAEAAGAILLSGGKQIVSSGGTALACSAMAGSIQYVYSGGTSLDAAVAGSQRISGGGLASGAAVAANGAVLLLSGAEARGASLEGAGAVLRVSSGGLASGIAIAAGASLSVHMGGSAAGAVLGGAGARLAVHGMASGIDASSGGTIVLNSGGMLQHAVLSGGTVFGAGGAGFAGKGNVLSGASASGRFAAALGAELLLAGGNAMQNAVFTATGPASLSFAGTGNVLCGINFGGGAQCSFDVSRLSAGTAPVLSAGRYAGDLQACAWTLDAAKAQSIGSYAVVSGVNLAGTEWSLRREGAAAGTLAVNGSALAGRGVDYSLSCKAKALSLTVAMHAGKTLKGGSGANRMAGTSHSDIFYGAGGSDVISGADGRDVAVFGPEGWGKTAVKQTSGTMTLIFSGLGTADVVSSLAGSVMTFAKASDPAQTIAVSGWNAAAHKVVYGKSMTAFSAWASAAKPTAAQTSAMQAEVWKKAGLAAG